MLSVAILLARGYRGSFAAKGARNRGRQRAGAAVGCSQWRGRGRRFPAWRDPRRRKPLSGGAGERKGEGRDVRWRKAYGAAAAEALLDRARDSCARIRRWQRFSTAGPRIEPRNRGGHREPCVLDGLDQLRAATAGRSIASSSRPTIPVPLGADGGPTRRLVHRPGFVSSTPPPAPGNHSPLLQM